MTGDSKRYLISDGKLDDVRVTAETEPTATNEFASSDHVEKEAKGSKMGEMGVKRKAWKTRVVDTELW